MEPEQPQNSSNSSKRAHSGLPQHLEETQFSQSDKSPFADSFTVDTTSTWLHCSPVTNDQGTVIGSLYSHRKHYRPLLIQYTMDEGVQKYMVAYQDSEDEVGFQLFALDAGEKIEEALYIISEGIYSQMPALESHQQMDLLECAFCQEMGINQQPLIVRERRRTLFKAQRQLMDDAVDNG